jgi:hypothetical protein
VKDFDLFVDRGVDYRRRLQPIAQGLVIEFNLSRQDTPTAKIIPVVNQLALIHDMPFQAITTNWRIKRQDIVAIFVSYLKPTYNRAC